MYTHQDTEDVVQNAWVSIFKGLSDYKHDDKFEAWIKVIVIRQAWSARSKNKHLELNLGHQNKLTYEIEGKIIDRMTCNEILDILEYVPFGSREVFKMYVLEGYKHFEIAEILGIAVSTSRAHLTQARKILKKIFFRTYHKTPS